MLCYSTIATRCGTKPAPWIPGLGSKRLTSELSQFSETFLCACCVAKLMDEALPHRTIWHLVLSTQSLTLVEVPHLATCYSLLEAIDFLLE